ncbi:transposase [Dysgonomonas sp. Marseille-P4677]|uniref:transposase n=1 Tax=Dysgonomonas sp. Marseille-P4677 TaxID=2364790 RepID=UPI001913FD34|nr:transposase [Dysgonomonas sp. Marseille-P4677]MBK5722683.1 transposase [Dysgonomonas sp. Marseille-P4677]
MAKYSEDLLKRIIELVETDMFSVSEICRMTEINPKTFYEWKNTKPEFEERLKDAIRHRDEMLLTTARIGLKQLLEGYTVQEEKISYMPSKGNPANLEEKSRIVKKKHYPPNIRAIKMVLDRSDKKEERDSDRETSRPSVIIVNDEETKRQLLILRENKGESGGALKLEITAAVDRILETEKISSVPDEIEDTEKPANIISKDTTPVKSSVEGRRTSNIQNKEYTKASVEKNRNNNNNNNNSRATAVNTRILPPGYYK